MKKFFSISKKLIIIPHNNKKVKNISFAAIALLTLFLWIAGFFETTSSNQIIKQIELSPSPSFFKAQTAPNNPNIVLARVIRIIDGDTIEVDLGEGNKKKIRYIGIDTPEILDSRKDIQCFGNEASAKNKELVGNGIVGLEKDISETDRYGRLLRYVYMGDLFINQVLVKEGYAHSSSYPPDIKYQEKLKEAEQQARKYNRGLWKSCSLTPGFLKANPVD